VKGTCIVGIAHKGVVWMGCDSMASTDYHKARMRAPKIFRVGDMLVGVCGSLRARDVVETVALPSRAESETNDRDYLVRSYIPALRTAMKDAGVLSTDDGVDDFNGGMLVGYRGRVYQVFADFALMEHAEWATGSGGEYALGSLFSTSGDPAKRIKTALQAACEFSPSCGPPFVVEKL
jgi:ATP-dependent protease HslVU (ClpYQ) peptidase subunit